MYVQYVCFFNKGSLYGSLLKLNAAKSYTFSSETFAWDGK